MKKVTNILQLNFLPASASAGLLVLRLWLGLSICKLHGWSKLVGFSGMSHKFADPFGIGSAPSLGLTVFAEFVCGLLVALGLMSRLAALFLVINLTVAFFYVHKGHLVGPGSGEMAFVYLAGFVTILVAGPGRFSLDATLSGKRSPGS
jgi:putative oxidoreductase